MEATPKYNNPSPETGTNFISRLFFCWLFPFVWHGYKNGLQTKDFYNTTEDEMSEPLGDLLERNWDSELDESNKKKRPPNLLRVIIKTFWMSIMKFGLLLLIMIAIRCSQPYILGEYIRFFQKNNTKIGIGWGLGVAIFLTNFVVTLVVSHYIVHSQVNGSRIKVACSSLIFRKILKLNLTSLNQTAPGEVINLLSNDMDIIDKAVTYFHHIYCSPLLLIVIGYIMYNIVGISCFPGLVFIIIEAIPFQGYLSKVQGKFRSRIAQLTGKRLALMNDIVSGVQVIKMYAWEKPFEAVVTMARKTELNIITKVSFIKGLSVAVLVFTERLSLFLIIMTYVLLGNRLTGDIVFSMALLLNILQIAICFYFPMALESLTQFTVSIKRLQKFLLLDEKEPPTVSGALKPSNDMGCIKLINVQAGWIPTTLTLTDITLNIRQGSLCCVLGKVGSGKTSFLHLLMKELPASVGRVDVTGRISYASQEPWLFVATVRNNILFGQKFLQNKYEEVVKVCELYKDFKQFPHRDHTLVGERGVSLSGGQRARINLARAVYLDADIYLLDDPLSAVDTHVAKNLFQNCVKMYLHNKTRVLVTHQVQFLKQADLIIVLEEGKISNMLANDEVSENILNQLNKVLPTEEEIEESATKSKLLKKTMSVLSRVSIFSTTTTASYEEDEDENEETSKDVSFSTYFKYFSSGMSVCPLTTIIVIFIICQIVLNASDMWIKQWTNVEEHRLNSTKLRYNSTEHEIHLLPGETNLTNLTYIYNASGPSYDTQIEDENYFYLYVYSGIIVGCILLSSTRPMLFCTICISASKALHRKMLNGILYASMRFFETNPSGRILNRFSKDLGSVDEVLPGSLLWALQCWLVILGIVVMICIIEPWLLIPLLVTALLVYFFLVVFLPVQSQIGKLEANSRSPIFSQISATMNGLPTIRSTRAETMVRRYFDFLQDNHSSTWHALVFFNRTFCFYIETLCNLFLAVVTLQFLIFRRATIYGGDVGLVISQTYILSGVLQYGIAMTMDVMGAMVCVERVLQYTNVDKENADENANRERLMRRWPHSGKVTFSNVYLRYVPEDPPVINNLNLFIKAGEKIGIVGRTGAGKSSLISCLFRLAPTEGTVAIDDIDTSTVDLNTLRSRISIIPQEPVLFSETLRYNLDPLGTASDETLWKVLENVKLKDSIESLDMKVSNGGSNFSAGQRQLVCLARAILRNNKVLVMDEATANVDQNTDALIQQTIRDNFSTCTVLTIAHRLNTIMDSDKVLVMDLGRAVEFAHPHELLQKSNGPFSQMVREAGRTAEENLRKIAKKDFEKKFFD